MRAYLIALKRGFIATFIAALLLVGGAKAFANDVAGNQTDQMAKLYQIEIQHLVI